MTAKAGPAPVVVFAYARPEHLKRCLDSLAVNPEAAASRLIVYVDGPRGAADRPKVERTRRVAQAATGFGEIECHFREHNQGLADSITAGVTETLDRFGRVIVVEDDLVVSPFFLDYMNRALERYAGDDRVMHIAGHMLDVDPTGLPDAFFLRQSSCWGWATWDRAWKRFNPDAGALAAAFSQADVERFNLNDAYSHFEQLKANQNGSLKTWAVRWYASVFLQGGLCLHPARSLVINGGFDGSGENCPGQCVELGVLSEEPIITLPEAPQEHAEALSRYSQALRRCFAGPAAPQPGPTKPRLRSLIRRGLGAVARRLRPAAPPASPVDHEAAEYAEFLQNGRIPWTPGYERHKWNSITQVLAAGDFIDRLGREGFGERLDERIVEYPWLFSRLPRGPLTMLDAGSALNHAPLLDRPELGEKKLVISTLAPEANAFWNRGISYLYEDLRKTVLRDAAFDVVACISTLEHVGLDNTELYTNDPAQAQSAPESHLDLVDVLRRLVKPGGVVFISVPYGRAVNHGWFQVFDQPMIEALIARFGPSRHTATVFQYADARWRPSDFVAAGEATCFDASKRRDFDPDYAAFSRAVACLELHR